MKIVIDANLWISFAIGKRLNRLEKLLKYPRIDIFHTEQLITELNDVVQRPKLAKYINQERKEELFELLLTYSQLISISKESRRLSRDRKDDYLLELCHKVGADFLLTGDNDLLILQEFECTKIVLFNHFMDTQLSEL